MKKMRGPAPAATGTGPAQQTGTGLGNQAATAVQSDSRRRDVNRSRRKNPPDAVDIVLGHILVGAFLAILLLFLCAAIWVVAP